MKVSEAIAERLGEIELQHARLDGIREGLDVAYGIALRLEKGEVVAQQIQEAKKPMLPSHKKKKRKKESSLKIQPHPSSENVVSGPKEESTRIVKSKSGKGGLRDEISDILSDCIDEPMSPAEIHACLKNPRTTSNTRACIARMRSEGLVERTGDGKYKLIKRLVSSIEL